MAGELVLAALLCPAQPLSPLTGAAAKTPAITGPEDMSGTVIGTVEDVNGNTLEGATVTLTTDSGQTQTAIANGNGFFQIRVEPGIYIATVSSPGLSPWTSRGLKVAAGEFQEIPGIVLKVVPAFSMVRVTPPTRQEIAEEQIHAQEHQRVAGILPNFYISYVADAAPLTTRQKVELAWKDSIDPGSFAADAITGAVEQAQNQYPAYHQGMKGYAKRFGAAYGNDVGGTWIGAAILPTLFRQDPRYFWRGRGSVWSRALYAVSTIGICKGDNGRWQPNYSFVLGNLASGALSNVYYPAGNRGWATTLKGGALSSLQGISGRLMQEFLLKRVSRGVTE